MSRDVTVIGYSPNETQVFAVRFENAFPTDWSINQFTTADQNDSILKFSVTFDYDRFVFV